MARFSELAVECLWVFVRFNLAGELPEAFILRRIVSLAFPGLQRTSGLPWCLGLHALLIWLSDEG